MCRRLRICILFFAKMYVYWKFEIQNLISDIFCFITEEIIQYLIYLRKVPFSSSSCISIYDSLHYFIFYRSNFRDYLHTKSPKDAWSDISYFAKNFRRILKIYHNILFSMSFAKNPVHVPSLDWKVKGFRISVLYNSR